MVHIRELHDFVVGTTEFSHYLSQRLKILLRGNSLKDNTDLLVLQMEKAWQELTDAHKQVLLCREAWTQAEENLKVNRDSYNNGLSSVSDLLEAQALLQQSNDQLTDAMAAYRIKLVYYLQVTGR
jgi:outer membrane protein